MSADLAVPSVGERWLAEERAIKRVRRAISTLSVEEAIDAHQVANKAFPKRFVDIVPLDEYVVLAGQELRRRFTAGGRGFR